MANRNNSIQPGTPTRSHPMVQRGLCRKTNYINENNENIEIDYDDLNTLKELGSGQYGIVLKCLHTKSNLMLAAKRINIYSENEERKKEIMDLEVALKSGSSEFIVKFYGALFADGYLWILSEVMDASLDKFYKLADKLDESFISRIAYSVLMGIDFLRSKLIMHRNIKPSNMLINRDGKIKLSGFGNNNNCFLYMAPEIITYTDSDQKSSEGYTIKSDIWSLGISIFEIATFKHPFEDAKNYFAQLAAITVEELPKLPNKFSPEFRSFIDKCLMRNPDERGDLKSLINDDFIKINLEKPIDLAFIEGIINVIENQS